MEIKAYVGDTISKEFREATIKRFGYFKGSLSKGIEEAIIQWIRRNDQIEERLNNLVRKAENDDKALAVFLFGSYAEKSTSYRDIDVAILFKKGVDEISALSKYDDFVDFPRFDVSCLNSLSVIVRKEVIEKGILLYSKNKEALYELMDDSLKEYESFNSLYELILHG